MSAFGHYTLLEFFLADLLHAPIAGRAAEATPQKAVVQRMLVCPHLSRVIIAYGAHSNGDGAHRCFEPPMQFSDVLTCHKVQIKRVCVLRAPSHTTHGNATKQAAWRVPRIEQTVFSSLLGAPCSVA